MMGVEDLLNGTRKHKNKEILLNEIKRFIYTIKYENNGGLVDFFHFISKMNLTPMITLILLYKIS